MATPLNLAETPLNDMFRPDFPCSKINPVVPPSLQRNLFSDDDLKKICKQNSEEITKEEDASIYPTALAQLMRSASSGSTFTVEEVAALVEECLQDLPNLPDFASSRQPSIDFEPVPPAIHRGDSQQADWKWALRPEFRNMPK